MARDTGGPASSTAAAVRWLTGPERVFDTTLGVVCVGLGAFALGFPALDLHIIPGSALGTVGGAAALLVMILYYRRRREPRIQDTLRIMLWAIALSSLYIFPMYMAARSGAPLRDNLLASADAQIGFDAGAFVAQFAARPGLRRAFDESYDSLRLVSIAALMVPPLAGRTQLAKELLVALAVSVTITLLMYWGLQAVGPWVVLDIKATAPQEALSRAYRLLKAPGAYPVDVALPDPLIAFPSWHVILAVLSAMTLARVRVRGRALIAPFALLWGASVVISTLATGWHYLVDVLGGLLVSAVGYGAAIMWSRWEAGRASPK